MNSDGDALATTEGVADEPAGDSEALGTADAGALQDVSTSVMPHAARTNAERSCPRAIPGAF